MSLGVGTTNKRAVAEVIATFLRCWSDGHVPDERALRARARAQHGVVTISDLFDTGFTVNMIRGRVERGILTPLYPGVYLIAGVPITWETRVYAAQEWLGPAAVVSHRSAAALFDLAGFEKQIVELTVRGDGRVSAPNVLLHRSTTLPEKDFVRRGVFRVTRIERTLIDLGAVVPSTRVEIALDSALFQGWTTFNLVDRYLGSVRRSGQNGSGVLGKLLEERDPSLAPGESLFETKFYRLLRQSQIPGLVHQHRVHDQRGFVARLDIAFPRKKVGVEAHSLRWHSPRERTKRDAERHNRLTAAGWRVLYETYDTLENRPHEVLERLQRLLDEPFVEKTHA